jgi:hypothetical protein
VPAVSSSLNNAALENLGELLPAGDRAVLAGQCPSLREHLARYRTRAIRAACGTR